MWNPLNMLRLFSKKPKSSDKNTVQIKEQVVEDGWLNLSLDESEEDCVVVPSEEDCVVVPQDAFKEEFETAQLTKSVELLAKNEVYKLSIPLEEHRDKAAAAEQRLAKQGFKTITLGTEETRAKGIHVYALINQKNPDAPITIVARGTALDASIIADLDPTGPAGTVVEKNSAEILKQVNGLMQEYNRNQLRITGHSLGGSIAQLLTAKLLQTKKAGLEQSNSDSNFAYDRITKLSRIDTAIFQSAGVSEAVCKQAKEALVSIQKKQRMEMNFTACVKVNDLVSQTGQQLFSEIEAEYANVSLIPMADGKPALTLGDFFDVGVSSVMNGTIVTPHWVCFDLVKKLFSRFLQNRVEDHTSLFFHKREDDGSFNETFFPHGVYRNSNEEDAKVIKEYFQRNIVKEWIPRSQYIKEVLHRWLSTLNSEELSGLTTSSSAIMTILQGMSEFLMSQSTSSSNQLLTAFKKGPKVAQAFQDLTNHQDSASSGFLKLFGMSTSQKHSCAVDAKTSATHVNNVRPTQVF